MAYIRKTQQAIIGKKPVKGFPVILSDEFEVYWLSLNYLLEKSRSNSLSSVRTYSQHLCDFFSQLEIDEIPISSEFMTEDYLLAYKSSVIDRDGSGKENTENYASQIIRTVIDYFMWLESEKFTNNLIGESSQYRIRIKRTNRGFKHPLTRALRRNRIALSAPRTGWIQVVKNFGPKNERASKRFQLMIDWGKTAGLRAFEACNLKVIQMPERDAVQNAIADGKKMYIRLTVTKGRQPKVIPVPPLLIKHTWDYIDIERAELIQSFHKKARSKYELYNEPKEVFLSEKTGRAISSVAFSNSIRKAFLEAVEAGELSASERVWCHGLRHNFSVTLLKGLDKEGVPRPEAVGRQATRHGSEEAMEPYLSERFNDEFSDE